MQVGCEMPGGSRLGLSQGPLRLPTKVLEDIRDNVAASLKEVADLLCPAHEHQVTAAYLPPGVNAAWYTLAVPCCENDIGWKLEMYSNCVLRTVMRCKMVKLIEDSPVGKPAKFLQPRMIWGEALCTEMVELIYNSDPLEKWWLDEKLIKDNQPADTCPDPDEELYMDEPEVGSEEIESNLEGNETANHPPGSDRLLERICEWRRRISSVIKDNQPADTRPDPDEELYMDEPEVGSEEIESNPEGGETANHPPGSDRWFEKMAELRRRISSMGDYDHYEVCDDSDSDTDRETESEGEDNMEMED
ncbi:unnamed protein product [Tuber aestivum]|uniref:Uncharacterized protein n=1 Tax=Tuber aestivum TaxID=59557 RepID=A0A292Q6I4_9PEZI|nr:unnamed protein product [Tuber aestivum]